MSYTSLYRKYRPKYFNEIVGQEVVVKILKNSIINNKIGHAYIFSGPRGTGKTSIAKIFSKAVNCLNNKDGDLCGECEACKNNFDNEIDIVEIDAASNNGVDEIREIRNNVKLMPSSLKYKVYIIDEVHMLSTNAFNALLKTLEEPPSHVIFILATTEFNKIPSTVISRCQKFDFKKIKNVDIIKRLSYICDNEKVSVNSEIIELIAQLNDGGLRDSINMLDQVISINKDNITRDDVYNLIGEISEKSIFELLDLVLMGNIKEVMHNLDKYYDEGKNFINISNRLEVVIKDILIFNNTNNYFNKEYEKQLYNYSKVDFDKLLDASKLLFELINELKKTNNQKIITDIYFIKLALLFNDNENSNNLSNNFEQKIVKNISQTSENTGQNDDIIEKENIKKIKINNSLFEANKELKNNFKAKFNEINDYVIVKEYNSIASLLLKSTPEVVGENNIIFTFKNNFEVVLFEKNLEEIQKFLKILYNNKYEVVSITEEEWKTIKKEYVANIKAGIKYEYIKPVEKVSKSKKKTELQNSVENIFGEDFVSM